MQESNINIDNTLNEGDLESLKVIENGYHFIRTLVTDYSKKKDLISINYKTDLKSGIRLDPIHYFTNDGLMDRTIYYYEDKPVLEVSEIYKYNQTDAANSEMMISKRGIHSRQKTWRYYFEDGTLDNNNVEGTYKVKEKFYKTDIEGLVVGAKRRKNISIILSERVGTMLVILGLYQDPKEVKDIMRSVSATYSSSFQEYEKYGTEYILDDILDDDIYPWLNTYVPSKTDITNMVVAGQMSEINAAQLQGAISAYNIDSLQGMTIRNYFCEKLKGNIE